MPDHPPPIHDLGLLLTWMGERGYLSIEGGVAPESIRDLLTPGFTVRWWPPAGTVAESDEECRTGSACTIHGAAIAALGRDR